MSLVKLPTPPAAFHYIDAETEAQDECRRLGDLIAKHPIDVAFIGIGENSHLAFNDPPADFETEEPYLVVDLDEACRRQQLGEGWFPTFDDVPRQAISMSIRASATCSTDRRSQPGVERRLPLSVGAVEPVQPAVQPIAGVQDHDPHHGE